MEFPELFHRGLSNKGALTEEGYISTAAFSFDDYNGASRNDDGFCELSINWHDSEEAVEKLLNQKKSNTEDLQFKVGYCTISLPFMKQMLKSALDKGDFSYERRPIEAGNSETESNPFHGNLLMKNTLSKNARKNIQHSLAQIAGNNITFRDEFKLDEK